MKHIRIILLVVILFLVSAACSNKHNVSQVLDNGISINGKHVDILVNKGESLDSDVELNIKTKNMSKEAILVIAFKPTYSPPKIYNLPASDDLIDCWSMLASKVSKESNIKTIKINSEYLKQGKKYALETPDVREKFEGWKIEFYLLDEIHFTKPVGPIKDIGEMYSKIPKDFTEEIRIIGDPEQKEISTEYPPLIKNPKYYNIPHDWSFAKKDKVTEKLEYMLEY